MSESTVQRLIREVEEKTSLSKDDIAAKLREMGFGCSSSTLFKWARGVGPARNSAETIGVALQTILTKHTRKKANRK